MYFDHFFSLRLVSVLLFFVSPSMCCLCLFEDFNLTAVRQWSGSTFFNLSMLNEWLWCVFRDATVLEMKKNDDSFLSLKKKTRPFHYQIQAIIPHVVLTCFHSILCGQWKSPSSLALSSDRFHVFGLCDSCFNRKCMESLRRNWDTVHSSHVCGCLNAKDSPRF